MISLNTVCEYVNLNLKPLNLSHHLIPHRHVLTLLSKLSSATSNNLRMRKIDSANSVKGNSNGNNYNHAISQRKAVCKGVLIRINTLLVKPKFTKSPQKVVVFDKNSGILKNLPNTNERHS
jgi:hypothetical protein